MLGVEALPHNVAAARQAAAQAAVRQAASWPDQPACTPRFVAEALQTDASAPRRVAALLTTAWPESAGDRPETHGNGEGVDASGDDGGSGAESGGEGGGRGGGGGGRGGGGGGGSGGGGVLVCALHACGDLTPTLTRCVAALGSCRALVAVPCCYNLLTVPGERRRPALKRVGPAGAGTDADADAGAGTDADADTGAGVGANAGAGAGAGEGADADAIDASGASDASDAAAGFPASRALRDLGVRLSHPARTLACQGHRTAAPPPTAAPTAPGAPGAPGAPASPQLLRSLLELLLRTSYAAAQQGHRAPARSHRCGRPPPTAPHAHLACPRLPSSP